MAVQTTFGAPAAGCIGSLYNYGSTLDTEIDNKTAAAAVKFGRGVYTAAATPNVCAVPTSEATAQRFAGVTVEDRTKANGEGYAAEDEVRILKRGRIRVYFETAMTDGQSVYVRVAGPTAADYGQFRGDTDGAYAVLVPNAVFRAVDVVLSAAGIGVLEVNVDAGVGYTS